MTSAPARSIGASITALVSLITIPLILLSSVFAVNLAMAKRDSIESERSVAAEELSALVDQEFSGLQGVLVGLAATSQSSQGDMTPRALANAFRPVHSDIKRLWNFSRDSTAIKTSEAGNRPTDDSPLTVAMADRVFRGETVIGPVEGEGLAAATVILAIPVWSGDTISHGLAAEVRLADFDTVFARAGMRKSWIAAVVDGSGRFIARNLDSAKRVGTLARPELGAVARGPEDVGSFKNVTLEGTSVVNSYLRSELTKWTSVVAVPESELTAPLYRALAGSVLGGLLALVVSLGAARLMAARIAEPVVNLSRFARAVARGEPAPLETHHIREIDEVRASLQGTIRQAAQFSALVASSGDAILSISPDDTIASWNKGAEQLFGYAPEAIIGRPKSVLVPEDKRAEFSAVRQRLQAGETVRIDTVRLKSDGSRVDVEIVDAPIFAPDGSFEGYSSIIRDLTDRRAAEAHKTMLMRELAHRTKNQLAIIQSIARQTARHSLTLDGFLDTFVLRMQGLATSHDILSDQNWTDVSLRELITSHLGVLVDTDARGIKIEGSAIFVGSAAAEAIGLAIHELATNSIKYGAMSVPEGRVAVTWAVEPREAGKHQVQLNWTESGGPTITEQPERQGFGSRVIRHLVGQSLQGHSDIHYLPQGVHWQLTWVQDHNSL